MEIVYYERQKIMSMWNVFSSGYSFVSTGTYPVETEIQEGTLFATSGITYITDLPAGDYSIKTRNGPWKLQGNDGYQYDFWQIMVSPKLDSSGSVMYTEIFGAGGMIWPYPTSHPYPFYDNGAGGELTQLDEYHGKLKFTLTSPGSVRLKCFYTAGTGTPSLSIDYTLYSITYI
jgi:hypothetical protein